MNGAIVQLFTKRAAHKGVEPCSSLHFQRGYGIVEDASAIAGSPRQVLLVGTASLDRFGLQPGQLQENILLEGDVEQWSSGQVVQVGDRALLRLTFLCEPCATLEKLQPGLVKRIQGKRGMLAMVVRSGTVAVGDVAELTSLQFEPIPERNRDRLYAFASRIPAGSCVTTVDLLLALGLTQSYARAIPAMLKGAPAGVPVHRIVSADRRLIEKHLPHQAEVLAAEGVSVKNGRVDDRDRWTAAEFYDLGCFDEPLDALA